MFEYSYGPTCILFAILTAFLSWKKAGSGDYKLAVFFLVLTGLILRVYTASDAFLHPWDERFHALVAKNLMEHPLKPTLYDNPVLPYHYKVWSGNHIWVHKQPLPLWTMALSLKIFGLNEIALRLPSILLTSIGIYLSFYIGTYFSNKRVGYLASFLYAINGLIIEITAGRIATDHIDIFFLFFVELSVFFSIKFAQHKKLVFNILAGISLGAAILSKWLPALIVLPIWLLLVMESKKLSFRETLVHFTSLIVVSVIIFLPWQLYIFSVFPTEANWEASFNLKHITEVLDNQAGPFYYFFNQIRINYGDLIYLPLIWFFWQMRQNILDKKRLALLIWFLIPILFFSIAKTKMQGYILFVSPALFIISAQFWYWLKDYRENHQPKWLYGLILVLMIALPIRYTFERMKPFDYRASTPSWVQDLKDLGAASIENGVLLNYNKPIEAMFYTKLVVYDKIPSQKVIQELISNGHSILINDDGNVPDQLRQLENVRIVNLALD